MLDLVAEGKNVFYTGSAGTGKSFTTRLIIQHFRDRYDKMFNHKVAVVAPTGIAAANVGGSNNPSATGTSAYPQYEDDFGASSGCWNRCRRTRRRTTCASGSGGTRWTI